MPINVVDIRTQVDLLVKDSIIDKSLLIDKYNYLYTISKSLFDFIIRNRNDFDQELFNYNLNKMLDCIINIQNLSLTQNDASEFIGDMLAKQFIPQCRD